ncbi:21431_t:CDS:2, partial [Entrophospora sp. SA101]
EKDLRVLAPSDYEIKIGIPDNPITYAWHGGSKFAKTNEFKDMSVTKSEYDEHGSNICLKKFGKPISEHFKPVQGELDT